MARPIGKINSRGQALVETLPAVLLLLALVVGVLGAAYFSFGRAWISYSAEQGLYCLAEGHGTSVCRHLISSRVRRALPWGTLDRVSLRSAQEEWTVEVQWHWSDVRFRVSKRLRIKDILKSKALSW